MDYTQQESKQHGIAPYKDPETRPERIHHWRESGFGSQLDSELNSVIH